MIVTEDYIEYTLAIKAKGAQNLTVFLDRPDLPEGSTLFLLSKDSSQIIEVGYNRLKAKLDQVSLSSFQGDEIIMKFYKLKDTQESTRLFISRINYMPAIHPTQFKRNKDGFATSEPCNINVNCNPTGRIKDGVVRIVTDQGSTCGACSGTLINNASNDGELYVLTALHCIYPIGNQIFGNYEFWFEYEIPSPVLCTNATYPEPPRKLVMDCDVIATNRVSDFALLRLKQPPGEVKMFFNGWDRLGQNSNGALSIHHPLGDVKKLSVDHDIILEDTSDFPFDDFTIPYTVSRSDIWHVDFDEGITQGGSSGSPLLDQNNNVIGQLAGGPSGVNICDQMDNSYGKFSSSWNPSNSTINERLVDHLAPDPSNRPFMVSGYSPYQVDCSSSINLMPFLESTHSLEEGSNKASYHTSDNLRYSGSEQVFEFTLLEESGIKLTVSEFTPTQATLFGVFLLDDCSSGADNTFDNIVEYVDSGSTNLSFQVDQLAIGTYYLVVDSKDNVSANFKIELELCCLEDLILNNTQLGSGDYIANNSIQSSSSIGSSESVSFKTAGEILLEPGFDIPTGAQFDAVVEDLDSDGITDECDDDKDGDGILNEDDNCMEIYNPEQSDFDNNSVGDVCEGFDAINIIPISPRYQISVGGDFVEAAPKVLVLDGIGSPITNQDVLWEITNGNGFISSMNSSTDANGHSSITWLIEDEFYFVLPCGTNSQAVKASVENGLELSKETIFEADKGLVSWRISGNAIGNTGVAGSIALSLDNGFSQNWSFSYEPFHQGQMEHIFDISLSTLFQNEINGEVTLSIDRAVHFAFNIAVAQLEFSSDSDTFPCSRRFSWLESQTNGGQATFPIKLKYSP